MIANFTSQIVSRSGSFCCGGVPERCPGRLAETSSPGEMHLPTKRIGDAVPSSIPLNLSLVLFA